LSEEPHNNAHQLEWFTFFGLVASGFVAMVVIGWITGYEATEKATLASVYSELQIIPVTSTEAKIAHVCNSKPTHIYDIDRHTVDTSTEVLQHASVGFSASKFMSPGRHKEVLMALLGGASGGVTLQGLVRSASSEAEHTVSRQQRVLTRVLVALTVIGGGYFIGNWLGYTEHNKCDDDERLALLGKDEFWSGVETTFVPLWLHDHGLSDPRFPAEAPRDYGEPFDPYALKAFSPNIYCETTEKTGARNLWEKVESRSPISGSDLAALHSYAKFLERGRRRGHTDPFVRCTSDLDKQLQELEKFGFVKDADNRDITEADLRVSGLMLPESCRSLTHRTSNLSREEYADVKASAWMKDLCNRELSNDLPGSYEGWSRFDGKPTREADVQTAKDDCWKSFAGVPILEEFAIKETQACMKTHGLHFN